MRPTVGSALRLDRRTVLLSIAAIPALGAGIAASQEDGYVIEQDEECTEITALSYEDQTVEEFYGYTLVYSPDVPWSANTPIDLEKDNDETSTLFVYEGPEGPSLVFIHGEVDGEAGGAATFYFDGLPEEGEWVVQDDPPEDSTDQWDRPVAGYDDVVDWTWRDKYTDGGAFHGGLEEEFEIEIRAVFNEDAELEPLVEGNVTEWRVLTVEDGTIEAIELDMDEPVIVRNGTCS